VLHKLQCWQSSLCLIQATSMKEWIKIDVSQWHWYVEHTSVLVGSMSKVEGILPSLKSFHPSIKCIHGNESNKSLSFFESENHSINWERRIGNNGLSKAHTRWTNDYLEFFSLQFTIFKKWTSIVEFEEHLLPASVIHPYQLNSTNRTRRRISSAIDGCTYYRWTYTILR
jgi:hypothetical protein